MGVCLTSGKEALSGLFAGRIYGLGFRVLGFRVSGAAIVTPMNVRILASVALAILPSMAFIGLGGVKFWAIQ